MIVAAGGLLAYGPKIPEMYRRLSEMFARVTPNYELIFVNNGSFDNSQAVLARLAQQDRRVVVVCRSGGRSARVTGYLRELGYDVVNLEGGLAAWQAANRALTGPVL